MNNKNKQTGPGERVSEAIPLSLLISIVYQVTQLVHDICYIAARTSVTLTAVTCTHTHTHTHMYRTFV